MMFKNHMFSYTYLPGFRVIRLTANYRNVGPATHLFKWERDKPQLDMRPFQLYYRLHREKQIRNEASVGMFHVMLGQLVFGGYR